MKILNLYAGIGGNREKWGNDHQVTAVELDPKRAQVYSDLFPDDTVVVADAHQYLLDHHRDFDFVWSSPPCQTHSRANYFLNAKGTIRYPDVKLWQEVIYLRQFHKGLFCVENVISYYEPVLSPQKVGRHYLWANFKIDPIPQPKDGVGKMCGKNQKAHSVSQEERNKCNPDLGLHVLLSAQGKKLKFDFKQSTLFGAISA